VQAGRTDFVKSGQGAIAHYSDRVLIDETHKRAIEVTGGQAEAIAQQRRVDRSAKSGTFDHRSKHV
jgi:hypothetical protein